MILVAILSLAATLIPMENELFGFDWKVFFSEPKNIPGHYPPWTALVLNPLTYPLLIGVTLATFIILVFRKQASIWSAIMSFMTFPLFWVIFLGQLDGLTLLGIIGFHLALMVPQTKQYLKRGLIAVAASFILIKPQVAAFALFARKEYFKAGVVIVAASFVFWGLWPLNMLDYYEAHTASADPWVQDIGLGWRGLPVFLFVLWKMPKHDTDWWMLAGAFITPTLIPYHLLPLMPAISRLRPWFAAAVALSTWLPLTSIWLGPNAWNLTWVSLLLLGFGLAYEKRKTGDLVPRLSGNIR